MKQKVVLIIDDTPDVRETVTLILRSWGYELIHEAVDGQHGVEEIARLCPDLVITDRDMPKMNGEELLRWITSNHKPLHPTIKTIALSGNPEIESVLRAAGCDEFVFKPFQLKDLKAAVDAVMA